MTISRMGALVSMLSMLVVSGGAAAVAAPSASVPDGALRVPAAPAATRSDRLTTGTFDRTPPIDLHWHLLNLPGDVLELLVLPLALFVEATERHRLDRRFADLLVIRGGAIKISPRLKLAFDDGLGLGAKIKFPRLLERRAVLGIGGLYRVDGDWLVDAAYVQQLGSIERRALRLHAVAERDANARYYGIGGGAPEVDRRALRDDDQGVFLGLDLFGRDSHDWSGLVELGGYRQRLAPGTDPPYPPSGLTGDVVDRPPGFGAATVFGHAAISARYDTRDTKGRPTRGTLIDVGVTARSDLGASDLAGANVTATTQWFFPVLPEARVIVLTVGGSIAVPLVPEATIPLSSLSTLGREHYLRGYDRARFRDHHAVWTSLEYRYPIYEYLTTGVGLDTYLFTDVATAFGEDAFAAERIRYSVGGGIRAAHETVLVFDLMIGYSPEGFQVVLGAEQQL